MLAMDAVERTAALPLQLGAKKLKSLRDGGHSSMVEPQIVVLAVAGSSPVGHPFLFSQVSPYCSSSPAELAPPTYSIHTRRPYSFVNVRPER